ncbi:transposase (plasmid) [Cupriavidus taiwanensis]|nr:transposase [Cupriavidus taiwanensis]
MWRMKQTDLGLNLSTKRTRKREFLDEMNRVVPWADLVMLIAPYARKASAAVPRSRSRQCCASTSFSNGSACRTRRWKKRCTTCRCIGSSPGWTTGR